MNKKLLLVVLALVLVCTIAITGTLAFLKESTEEVTNTFVAAGGGKLVDDPEDPDNDDPEDPYDDNNFSVFENEVEQDELGNYTTVDGEYTFEGNDYEVLPGTDLPKNPTVLIKGKTEVPAYLYVEVIDELGEDSGLTYALLDCWQLVEGVTGKNGGAVYVYTADGAPVIVTADVETGILVDDKITVADEISIGEDGIALSFYGYLAQANAGDGAAAAFTACFG